MGNTPGRLRVSERMHVITELDLLSGESKPTHNERATLSFDSRSEVSILDSTFARKGGCYIGDSQRQ
ncbi:Hypothetical protein PHPALM_11369 [Phytophthora palmivora]|uniref:Uncharacterized protein n=1 Tax=Phytophthora palmivora TaxID=4796 RepID=A0A2P4Y2G1_9STRA|nr:Hypothetical protein PHPALM_11369 [Phytophthora palmivora]